jgi:phage terminase large subunit GpA-like protein
MVTHKRGATASGVAKTIIYARLRADIDVLPADRHIRFSDELHQDFFRGICAEVFDPHKRVWVKTYERNEPLDTLSLNMGAAMHHGVRVQYMRDEDWIALERLYNPVGGVVPVVKHDSPTELRVTGRFMPTAARIT